MRGDGETLRRLDMQALGCGVYPSLGVGACALALDRVLVLDGDGEVLLAGGTGAVLLLGVFYTVEDCQVNAVAATLAPFIAAK